MYHKDIKSEVITQLKKEYPNWNSVPRKIKKQISDKVLKEVVILGFKFNGGDI
jgi:hypothetical protein